jgi:hypothetical protein
LQRMQGQRHAIEKLQTLIDATHPRAATTGQHHTGHERLRDTREAGRIEPRHPVQPPM